MYSRRYGSYPGTSFEEVIEANRRGTWTINVQTVHVDSSDFRLRDQMELEYDFSQTPPGMFNFLRRSPSYANREFSDLSFMLFQERESPTYKRELLDERKLTFSVESLKHLDEYLEALHAAPPHQEDIVRVVLRCGAYVGEVIRKNSQNKMNWVAFKEAAKHSDYVKGLGHSLGTAGVLWRNPKTMCFPLAKTCKFLENGNEDSVYFFARVILQDPQDRELAGAMREGS